LINSLIGANVGIKVNQRSKELLKSYSDIIQHDFKLDDYASVSSIKAIFELEPKQSISIAMHHSPEEIAFLKTSLIAQLLSDIHQFYSKETNDIEKKLDEPDWTAKTKYVLLAIAGTILAGCEGFDSITAMMGITSLPSLPIFIAGFLFSLLSIVVFFGFDLVEVAKNLGIKIKDAPKLLDLSLSQRQQMIDIRKAIKNLDFSSQTLEQLRELRDILRLMKERMQALDKVGKQFEDALNSTKLQVGKKIVSAIAGLLFFGGGFFAGQSVALYLVGFFVATATPTFWPVILLSVLVGCSAFGLYWYVQRPGLQRLLSKWFGLDEDKIEELCDTQKAHREELKLDVLEEKLSRKCDELESLKLNASSPGRVLTRSKSLDSFTKLDKSNVVFFKPQGAIDLSKSKTDVEDAPLACADL
jgi:hypothetical protein